MLYEPGIFYFTLVNYRRASHIMQGHQNPVQFIISDPYWGVLERDQKSSPCINLEIGSQISNSNYIIKKSQPLSYSTVII